MKKESKISTNLAWCFIVLGGVVECFWVSGLKHADSFMLYTLTALGICFSFCAMMLACKKIEVSIAYAVFVGIGTAGVVLGEILVFNQPFSALKISLIALLLFSVIALKFVSKDQDESIVSEFNENLGLDELENEFIKKKGGSK